LPTGTRIACVDDHVSVAKAVVAFLRSHGFNAEAFISAEAFLQSFDESDGWRLVITDVQLPGMSGLELQNKIVDTGLDLPIIFISAFRDDMIRSRAMDAGAVCFLTKPVTDDDLLACIDSAYRRNSDNKVGSR
jgi:FixJ family two-component response regulator